MFNGTNDSGKEFDVLDEEGVLLGSFEAHGDAIACARHAPWYAGKVGIRRDCRFGLANAKPGWSLVLLASIPSDILQAAA